MKNLRGSSSELTFTGHQRGIATITEAHLSRHTQSAIVSTPTLLDRQLFSIDSDLRR